MRTYELFTGNELKVAEKIQQRRYQLLIHSCIYYHLNDSIVSDDIWTKWAKELQNLQSSYPQISEQVILCEYFKDWDGSTGMFLPVTLPWVVDIANRLLKVRGNSVCKKKENVKRRLF